MYFAYFTTFSTKTLKKILLIIISSQVLHSRADNRYLIVFIENMSFSITTGQISY